MADLPAYRVLVVSSVLPASAMSPAALSACDLVSASAEATLLASSTSLSALVLAPSAFSRRVLGPSWHQAMLPPETSPLWRGGHNLVSIVFVDNTSQCQYWWEGTVAAGGGRRSRTEE